MDLEKNEPNINFIPCLTWVRRGVAKPDPERLKLSADELVAVISQTKKKVDELENEVESDGEKENIDIKEEQMDPETAFCIDSKGDNLTVKDEFKKEASTSIKAENNSTKKNDKTDEDIADEYGLNDYDEEVEGANNMLGLGDLTEFADPREDPYLTATDKDVLEDDQEDFEDFQIRGTDNLIVCGHVEGDSSSLEVYVYNDVEDALYVHHDILLPSFPLALEWLSFDPESEVRGSLVAVGSMQPIIEVWDLDIVDCLEPAFKLGRKGSKKKKISRIGHTDAVLALSWNSSLGHVLGSGSVDESCLLWDLSTQQVAAHLGRGEGRHREKVQAVQFHPFQAHSMATGCCDAKVRVFDCRSPDSPTHSWGVGGEVERVVWDHFNPHRCLASTDQGTVLCLDSRQPDKPAWTLSAHSEAVTGLSLSPQVPGLVTTVSTDSVLKVWDCGETDSAQPVYVTERDLKMGQLHAVQSCPDAPFVVCMGGDKRDNNFKVLDVRESAPVRQRFGTRKLLNPLQTSDFGFSTANEAEPSEDMETECESAAADLQSMSLQSVREGEAVVGPVNIPSVNTSRKPTPGIVSKFSKKKKEEKKAKKKNKML